MHSAWQNALQAWIWVNVRLQAQAAWFLTCLPRTSRSTVLAVIVSEWSATSALFQVCPSERSPQSLASINGTTDRFTPTARFLKSPSAKTEFFGEVQMRSLLRQTDFAYQFGVARIGAPGIERKVGPKARQQVVVFLVCGVEPLEGMILVAQIGI